MFGLDYFVLSGYEMSDNKNVINNEVIFQVGGLTSSEDSIPELTKKEEQSTETILSDDSIIGQLPTMTK